ncbi:DNA methyltransferase [Marinobacterium weihaiense]|uniref:site-specific DNA-methyltransferase (adenine-specific) n=1 Tax=Marinobacterium weihaiense TaxID=2851016 RepID=A0ABS6M6X6_9GAMM|nr:DNA methyltransferase [Marinobacterium weihaiense]MBV0932034.1 N-6 DNA methylase [Marinobacterium weihaiense]
MAFDQTYCMNTLQAATAAGADPGEFIYAFLDAYGFPRATITQVRNNGQRNVASRKEDGHVALKNWLYFMPVREGESVHEALQALADDDEPRRHKSRFLVVTDYREITALDTRTDERLEVDFDKLATQYLFFAPMAGLERTKHFEEASADLKAAAKMGRLFDRLKEHNAFETTDQRHALNVFLTRLLFCYFAEDTGIFKSGAFTRVITEASSDSGEDLPILLAQLFTVMNQPESDRPADLPAHISQFPYVNGGLFSDDLQMPIIGARARRMMIECGQLNWEAVNPDIFGSMFQAVVDEESRDSLGQHYTSVPNIMKVIRPLFLDDLYASLDSAKGQRKKLESLLERLTRVRIFDPAMGSGNFLIIAYKELRRLEMAVLRELQAVNLKNAMQMQQNEFFMSGIRLSQFYGIEIDDAAHEIAQLSLWLAEHQMNTLFAKEFGHAEPLLPLKDYGHLVLGNSLRMDWNAVCPNDGEAEVFVCGNPPFVGHGNRGDEQLDDMKLTIGKAVRTYKSLDYVACWFYLAAVYCSSGNANAAFVSTNSICQGKQTGLLWPVILGQGVKIDFAYQTFSWKNSAQGNAGVHVVIIGLSRQERQRRLFTRIQGEWHLHKPDNISPYLLEGGNTVVSERRKALVADIPNMIFGNMPNDGGHLLLSTEEKNALVAQTPEVSGCIKRLLGAQEFLQDKERWCLWLTDEHAKKLQQLPEIDRRIKLVESTRLASSDAGTRKLAERPHQFRDLNNPDSFILVPSVTSERRTYAPIGIFDSSVIATNLAMIIPNGTLYEFAILSTQMHMDWLRLVGGRLKSDYRYSATLVYNTFPWPNASDNQRSMIEKLGRQIILTRGAHPDKTLAQMYDPDKMPDDLLQAHQALDLAVERLYRERPFRDTAERQEFLLARYEALIEAEQRNTKTGARRRTSSD